MAGYEKASFHVKNFNLCSQGVIFYGKNGYPETLTSKTYLRKRSPEGADISTEFRKSMKISIPATIGMSKLNYQIKLKNKNVDITQLGRKHKGF